MKKVSKPFKRPDKAGWWVRWLDPVAHKRALKSFPTKALAEHFQHILYHQLNSDVFTSAIDYPWEQAKTEYLDYLQSRRAKETHKIASRLLDRFASTCLLSSTADITQRTIDIYLLERRKETQNAFTLNKDIQRLKTFIAWLKKRKYCKAEIELEKYQEPETKKQSLSDSTIEALLRSCPSRQWQLKIILCLCTGLRRNDLHRLPRMAVKLDLARVDTSESKTGKVLSAPIPDALNAALIEYDKTLPPDRLFFWQKINIQKLDKQFREFRPEGIVLHDLRKTNATRIETTGISTIALNHSSPAVTRKFYTDMDYIRYIRVNQLPVSDWLKIPFTPRPYVNHGRRGKPKGEET